MTAISRATGARGAAAALVLLLAACTGAGTGSPAPAPVMTAAGSSEPGAFRTPADEAEIRRLLGASADGWNRADLDAHVAFYADSATFMTGRGPLAGRDAIAAVLRSGFWADGKPAQSLRYEEVVVRPLGPDHALVTGRFVLSGGGQADASGWFSTTWRRTAAGWRVVHDHSS